MPATRHQTKKYDSDSDDSSGPGMNDIFRSVVKIFTTFTEPKFSQPWSMSHQNKATGTGFLVSGHRIITNAHVVAHHTSVQVRKHGSPDKYTARVLAIAHNSDLAILTVEDVSFWKDVTELEFGEMPSLQQGVVVIGYPVGGETISVTAGVVSRIDYDQYAHGIRENLVVQVDAAINPGNSGGPALADDGTVIGVAFQGIDADNIGYIIPVPVVQHVIADYEKNGRITGAGRVSFAWQTMENSHMRSYYGLPPGKSGVRVTYVYPTSAVKGVLHVDDIVTTIDGRDVADDASISLDNDIRVPFAAVYVDKFIGDTMELTIYRAGKQMDVTIPVEDVAELVPLTLYDKRPSYYVYGGLVFTALTFPYITSVLSEGGRAPPAKFLELAEKEPEVEGEQAVVLVDILSHPMNVGYDSNEMAGYILKSVDGKDVKCLADVVRVCSLSTEKYIRFTFSEGDVIILNNATARDSMTEVLKTNAIPSACSDDLLEMCNAGTAGAVSPGPRRRSKRTSTA